MPVLALGCTKEVAKPNPVTTKVKVSPEELAKPVIDEANTKLVNKAFAMHEINQADRDWLLKQINEIIPAEQEHEKLRAKKEGRETIIISILTNIVIQDLNQAQNEIGVLIRSRVLDEAQIESLKAALGYRTPDYPPEAIKGEIPYTLNPDTLENDSNVTVLADLAKRALNLNPDDENGKAKMKNEIQGIISRGSKPSKMRERRKADEEHFDHLEKKRQEEQKNRFKFEGGILARQFLVRLKLQ